VRGVCVDENLDLGFLTMREFWPTKKFGLHRGHPGRSKYKKLRSNELEGAIGLRP
jgi:hypothetical protein